MSFPFWSNVEGWKPFFKAFYRLDKAFTRERFSDQVSAIAVLFFRFVAVWGIGIVAFASPNGHDLAKYIQNNATVAATPSGYRAHWSLEILWYLTVWEFCWQVVAASLQACIPIHMLFITVDVLAFGGMCAGWSQSLQYIPRNETCTVNGSTWQAPPDGGLNLFAAIGQVADRSARDVCYTFTDVMETQKTSLVMIAIVIVLAVWLLLPPEHPISLPHILVYIFLPFGWLCRELIIHISFLVHYLAHKIWKKDPSTVAPIELRHHMAGTSAFPDRRYKSSSNTMDRVLGIEHILEDICKDLCYKDVVNLSRTSRSVHDMVVPPGDIKHRIKKLKSWTCGNGEWERGTCFACNRPVCVKCNARNPVPSTDLAHGTRCKPACTWCYYTKIIRNRAQTIGRQVCKGHGYDASQSPQYFCGLCARGFETRKDLASKRKDGLRDVRDTDRGDVEKWIEVRVMAEALLDAQAENCRFCGSRFTWVRRRWWHCSKCQMECRSPIHPQHLSRRRRDPLGGIV